MPVRWRRSGRPHMFPLGASAEMSKEFFESERVLHTQARAPGPWRGGVR